MALPGRGARPKNTLPLLTSTVKMDAEDPSMRCCFRVVSPSGTYTLQAESEFERAEWIAALQVSAAAGAANVKQHAQWVHMLLQLRVLLQAVQHVNLLPLVPA
jgi:hypothetical protein